MANVNKILKQQELEEAVEFILSNKASWSDFTRWATEKNGIGHTKANRMWNECWEHIQNNSDSKIQYQADSAFIELEQLKQRALQENDRRTYLEAVKYQGKIKGLEQNEWQNVNINFENVKMTWGGDNKESSS